MVGIYYMLVSCGRAKLQLYGVSRSIKMRRQSSKSLEVTKVLRLSAELASKVGVSDAPDSLTLNVAGARLSSGQSSCSTARIVAQPFAAPDGEH